MAPVIAEELLLLINRPDGRVGDRGPRLDMALAGALLAELVLDGHVELIDKKLKATGLPEGPEHPGLAAALKRIGSKAQTPDIVITKLADRVRQKTLADLVEAGVVTKRYQFFPIRKYPPVDLAPREDALRRLRATVFEGVEPDRRTAVLAAVVLAGKLAPLAFPGDDREAVKARLAEVTEGDWTVDAVRRALLTKRISEAVALAVTVVVAWVSTPG